MIVWFAAVSCILALVPMGLFLRNLDLYARLPPPGRSKPKCSVLIPARNEEAGIASAIHSVLRNENADLEVIVLDDGSTDHTAEIVRKLAAADARVRFETALPLPPGWCGKQHACYLLAHLARHPLLVFMDADVRLEPDALARMAAFMEHGGCALASGIPREEMKTFSERLLIPLIHFIMLGFLPIQRMRATMDPACSAGCGQLFIARRDAYHACGGHRAIRDSLHDGAKLPRVFRSAGFKTDLFDATDIANCRMFLTNPNVWRGLGRNAHEGLAAPRLIGPATLILFGGQICPLFLLVAVFLHRPATGLGLAFPLLGTAATFLPRLLAVGRFRQPLGSALLHPIGICGLLAIQWLAFFRARGRRPSVWKGRSYLQSQPA